VLVADPDQGMLAAIERLLRQESVSATVCGDGASALYLAGSSRPDLLLVSAELPACNAPDVITVVRERSNIPVFVGIGAGQADAAGPALAAGATGLLHRPYEQREIGSLLDNQLERVHVRLTQEAVVRLGPLQLDSPAFEARLAGRPLELTLREFELLRFLMLHADRAVTKEQIQIEVWGARGEEVSANTIAVHIGRLRMHLADYFKILNIRNVGYRLVLPAGADPSPG
jgi:DNA-binding response OmpR family regulator